MQKARDAACGLATSPRGGMAVEVGVERWKRTRRERMEGN